MIQDIYSIVRANKEGKKFFIVERGDWKKGTYEYKMTIASDIEQCQKKYRGWNPIESTMKNYIEWVTYETNKELG